MTEFTLIREGKKIYLGQELGRGGEGTVFAVDGLPDRVAKIYTTRPDTIKAQKLLVMAGAATPSLLKIAAWPVDLLADKNGAIRGFLMPRVSGRKDIHELYSPKTRAEAFPEADFRFVVHVAGNIARAFAVVHDEGHLVGDVNHGNLLVGTDGTVMLIDCDSFQIGNGANAFTCDVGVPLFTAPEINGRSFRGLIRTVDHDRFGLAVLLFHLLYMGRHPFAGRYSGHGEMPIEKAVAEYRFAYGPDRNVTGMAPPPNTLPLESLGGTIAYLFIRAFGPVDKNGRPDSKTWVEALEKLKQSLRLCSKAPNHHFPAELPTCPWCTIEAKTGARLFGQRIIPAGPSYAVDVGTLWNSILTVPDPGPDPELPSNRPWNPPPHKFIATTRPVKVLRKLASITLICVGLAGCNILIDNGGVFLALFFYWLASVAWPKIPPEELAAADRAISVAKSDWEGALSQWRKKATSEAFARKIKELTKCRADFEDLPKEYMRRISKLEAGRAQRQRMRYLDRFRIDRAHIRGIGAGRSAMLASYGIETAADVDRHKILGIPGFGPTLTTELIQWRQEHERNFIFNPSEGVEKRDIDALDQEFQQRRQNILSTLQQGLLTLTQLSQEIQSARQRLMPVLEQALTELKIAEVKRKSL